MKPDRRSFLSSLGAVGALTACSGGKLLPQLGGEQSAVSTAGNLWHPLASGLLPIEIVNNTPYANKDIWFYTVGQKKPGHNPWFHITNAKNGTLVQCQASDANKNGYADYSLNLAQDTDSGKMMLPAMNGGCRMYLSINAKLKIPIGANAIPGSPPGWVAADPNYDTIFDWWEFVNLPLDPEQGFNGNLTSVDMMGIPMSIRVFGSDVPSEGLLGGFKPGARAAILNGLKAKNAWAKTVVGNVRAIAPNLAIDPASSKTGTPLFSDTYLDPYIDEVWTYYKTHKLKTIATEGTYYAQVDDKNHLLFTLKGQEPYYFKKPSTLDVFAGQMLPYCGNAVCPPPPGYLAPSETRGAIAAAFNRTTLLLSNELGIATASAGCKESLDNAYKNSITNYYAKIIHANSIGGKAYAFGNDDVCSASSFIASRKPTKAVITLLKFK